VSLFPPKSGSSQKPKEREGFRARDDQRDYLERMKKRGHSKTKVLVTALDILIDAEKVLGSDLKIMEALAEVHGLTLGTVVAEAAKIGWVEYRKQLTEAAPQSKP
jgi:hypothetical protein